jgi:hypothetical protein
MAIEIVPISQFNTKYTVSLLGRAITINQYFVKSIRSFWAIDIIANNRLLLAGVPLLAGNINLIKGKSPELGDLCLKVVSDGSYERGNDSGQHFYLVASNEFEDF